ncbi:Serp2-like protein [Leptotrombidium deliense]|uniref:Serp2-like protein n=1 Tax=Leptotrombidium deliense TaxID=299467 RepID=A0A443SSI5_9ACAR|nr:Serp2-like protein [Leptotrombidium deliense]
MIATFIILCFCFFALCAPYIMKIDNSKEKVAKACLAHGLNVIESFCANDDTNPIFDAFNSLSGEVPILQTVEGKYERYLFHAFKFNTSFSNPDDVVKTFYGNTHLMNIRYNAIKIYVISDEFNVTNKFMNSFENLKFSKLIYNASFDENPEVLAINIKKQLMNATNDTIDEELDWLVKVNQSDRLVAYSAAEYSKRMLVAFDQKNSKRRLFYNDGFKKRLMRFMSNKGEYKHYSNDKYAALDVAYEHGDHLMVILPNKDIECKSLLQNLTVDEVFDLNRKLQLKNVSVSIPLFDQNYIRTRSSYSSHERISFLLTTAAYPSLTQKPLVKKVYFTQSKAVIRFKLSEAGIYNATSIPSNTKLTKFIANRPFIYFLFTKRNIALFVGVLNRL